MPLHHLRLQRSTSRDGATQHRTSLFCGSLFLCHSYCGTPCTYCFAHTPWLEVRYNGPFGNPTKSTPQLTTFMAGLDGRATTASLVLKARSTPWRPFFMDCTL